MNDLTVKNRRSPVRQDNPMALPPHVTVPAIIVPFDIKQRKVGKKGAVTIAGLTQGVNVNVARVDPQTYLVSSRPIDELRALTAAMPKPPKSPFAAIAESMRGRKHDLAAPRLHGEYVPSEDVEIADADERGLTLDRTRRAR